MDSIEKRLTLVMEELGFERKKDLAKFCGVTPGLVTQWFQGRTTIGGEALIRLSETNFSLDWIVNNRGPRYRKDAIAQQPATSKHVVSDDMIELLIMVQKLDDAQVSDLLDLARSWLGRAVISWKRTSA